MLYYRSTVSSTLRMTPASRTTWPTLSLQWLRSWSKRWTSIAKLQSSQETRRAIRGQVPSFPNSFGPTGWTSLSRTMKRLRSRKRRRTWQSQRRPFQRWGPSCPDISTTSSFWVFWVDTRRFAIWTFKN